MGDATDCRKTSASCAKQESQEARRQTAERHLQAALNKKQKGEATDCRKASASCAKQETVGRGDRLQKDICKLR